MQRQAHGGQRNPKSQAPEKSAGPRVRGRAGGADLALIRAAGDYRIDSFSEVVVVSGDGIFAGKVSELARQAAVTVVTRVQSASRALIRCAPRVVYA